MQVAFRWAVVALAAAGCAGQQTPEFESPRTSPVARKDIVIQFADGALEPSVARVKQGGSVTWVNVSSNYDGTVSFPESVVPHFTCKELRPKFFVAAGRLASIPIDNGGEDVSLPCPLAPGTYEYRIDLDAGGEGVGGRGMGMDPEVSLPGTLIVE